jgi:hypothetical protein
MIAPESPEAETATQNLKLLEEAEASEAEPQ